MMIKNNNLIFIAEIGLNHNGNFGLIYELIKQSAWSGADIAKFQLGWRSNKNEINCFKEDDINHIFKCCENFGIEPMFSIFTNDALELAKKFTGIKKKDHLMILKQIHLSDQNIIMDGNYL